eukprot:10973027-Prorocentrum_lima.AAC.1
MGWMTRLCAQDSARGELPVVADARVVAHVGAEGRGRRVHRWRGRGQGRASSLPGCCCGALPPPV